MSDTSLMAGFDCENFKVFTKSYLAALKRLQAATDELEIEVAAFQKYITLWQAVVLPSLAENQLEFYIRECFGVYLNAIDECMVHTHLDIQYQLLNNYIFLLCNFRFLTVRCFGRLIA